MKNWVVLTDRSLIGTAIHYLHGNFSVPGDPISFAWKVVT
jgi:hypothetical protein